MANDLPKVYLDAAPIIDLVKYRLGSGLEPEQEADAWHVLKLLQASRDGKLQVITSSISIAECTHVKDKSKFERAKPILLGLLASGRGGIVLAQPTLTLMEKARDLRWLHGITLSGMDAIHAATALRMGCKELLHRDGKFTTNGETLANLGLRVCPPSNTRLLPDEYRQDTLTLGLTEASAEHLDSKQGPAT